MYMVYIYYLLYNIYIIYFYYIIKKPVECCARRVEEETDSGAPRETEKLTGLKSIILYECVCACRQ